MLENNSEEMQLAECEAAITAGMKTFFFVGEALFKIRENRLYKVSGYSSFEDYCSAKWKFEKAYADRLIASYNVMVQLQLGNVSYKKVSPNGYDASDEVAEAINEISKEVRKISPDLAIPHAISIPKILPVTESQVRPLTKLKDPEARAKVWDNVVKISEETDTPITAKSVERAVRDFLPDESNAMENRICSYLNNYNHNRWVKYLNGAKEAEVLRDVIIKFLDAIDVQPRQPLV
jgi:hypothetical protein